MNFVRYKGLYFILISLWASIGDVNEAKADGLENVFLLQDDDIDNSNGELSDQFITNFQFTSILLSRRAYGSTGKKPVGMYMGVDFSFIKVPDKVVSGAIDGVSSQFVAFPLPTLAFELSDVDMQENFTLTYINSNPTDQIKISYLTTSFGISMPVDLKKKWTVSVYLLYSASMA